MGVNSMKEREEKKRGLKYQSNYILLLFIYLYIYVKKKLYHKKSCGLTIYIEQM